LRAILGLAVSLAAALVWAAHAQTPEVPSDQWELRPGLSTYALLQSRGGELVSTSALPWPDGRSALILYIKAAGSYFQCVDYKDASFQNTGFICYELVNPKP
jgi:hypothetical protein